MITSTITFTHGKDTCASEPGVFCRWSGATGFGTRPCCMLFEKEPLRDKDGWLQRCTQCKKEFPGTYDY